MANLPELKFDAPVAAQGKLPELSFDGPEMSVKQNPGSHPTYGAPEYNDNPFMSFVRGANTGMVDLANTVGGGIAKAVGATPEQRASAANAVAGQFGGNIFGIKPSMPGTGANVSENIASTGVKSVPVMAAGMLGGPAGMAAEGGLEAYAKDQNIPIAVAQNFVLGKAWQIAGGLGAKAFVNTAVKMGIPENVASQEFLKRAGSSLGGGLVGAASSGGDPAAIAQGAGFNAMSKPAELSGADFNPTKSQFYTGQPPKMTQEQYDAQVAKHGDIYRQILNPGKNIIKKVETKGGGDIDNSTNLAAKMGLIINKDQNSKLDTTDARAQVQDAVKPLHEQLNQALQSNPEPQFNLEDIKAKAIADLKNNPKFKNAQEYEKGVKDISNLVDAEIRQNGDNPMVNGVDLNNAKEGMWSVSYDQSAPNNFHAARQLGNVMKSAIENGYKDNADIKALNQERGKYLQLDNLLAETHGNVIQKGKVGRYAMQAIGALTGHASHIPGAEIAGGWAAGKASDWMNDPSRITKGLADHLNSIEVMNPIVKQSFIKPQTQQPVLGLPFIPQETPAYLQERANAPINPLGNQFESPRPIPNESGIEQFKSPKEGEVISGQKPEEIPQSVKDQAKEQINQQWAKGIMSPFNPLSENPGVEKPGGTGLGNEKGSIDTGGRTPEDLKLELERNLKYKNSREYRSDKSYAQSIDKHISDLQQALKDVGKSTLGLNIAASGLVGGGMMFANQSNAQNSKDIDIGKINQIESSGIGDQIGDGGKAFGINQIHLGALSGFNKANGKSYTKEDLMSVSKNNEVANWYYNKSAPAWLKKNGIPDTIENRISFYNEGQGNLLKRIKSGAPMPKVTSVYIKKYKGAK